MNVVKENIDDLNALLKVQIAKDDYAENVKKSLNNYRRKAEIKGFRTGMAPMSIIQKMYGRPALLDEINRLVSESLGKYIDDEKLDILGEPIPNDDEQKSIDWDNQSDFEFVYEIGLAPAYELKINKHIRVPYHNITVSDSDKEKHVANIQQRFGKLEDAEVVGSDDVFKADLTQMGDNAIQVEDTYVSMRQITDDTRKAPFIGLKVGDIVEVDINSVYEKPEDIAQLLKIKKEELDGINPIFNVAVKEVKAFKPAEVNQDLFDLAYGKDSVKNEDEFMQRVVEEISKAYTEDSDYKFSIDAREKLIAKADLKLPEAFLKKWLVFVNEGKFTQEQIEKDFDAFAKDLCWQIIRDNIAKENEFKVEEADMKAQAINLARYQLAQYGMSNLPDEQLESFAQHILQDQKQSRGLAERVLENKVFAYLKDAVKLDEKEITPEDFAKLFEKQ